MTKKKNNTKLTQEKKELINDINLISPKLLEQITKQISKQVIIDINKKDEKIKSNSRRRSMDMHFELEELVPVQSVFHGTVECKTRSGKPVVWKECGSVQYMTIGDIFNMNSSDSTYLNRPLLLINDNEVSEYLNLTEINEMSKKVADLDEFLKIDIKEMYEILDNLSLGLKQNIYGELARKIENKEIYDLRIVRLISNKLGINYEK